MRGKRVEGKPVEPGRQRREPSPRPGETSVSKGSSSAARRIAHAPPQLRVIGGRWKRTLLPVVDAPGLRPTPNRVRETLFNWLAHFIGDFEPVRGLDLFAGTGALGFELASRGAADVTLVERSGALAAQLGRSREKLAAAGVHIVVGDALTVARNWPDRSFDVIFLDPPFDANLLAPALGEAARLVRAGGLVYVESGAALDPAAVSAVGLSLLRAGRAGQVHFHLLHSETDE